MSDNTSESTERRDTVKFLLDKQWGELNYRREREHKVAAWSMLLLGSAVLAGAAKLPLLAASVKHVFGMAATVLAVLIGIFLIENRKRYEVTQQVLTKLQEVMRVWDRDYWKGSWPSVLGGPGETLLPEKWLTWGRFEAQVMPRLDTIVHIGSVWTTAAASTLIVQGDQWVTTWTYVLIPLLAFLLWLALPWSWRCLMSIPASKQIAELADQTGDWWREGSRPRNLALALVFLGGWLLSWPFHWTVWSACNLSPAYTHATWHEVSRSVDVQRWFCMTLILSASLVVLVMLAKAPVLLDAGSPSHEAPLDEPCTKNELDGTVGQKNGKTEKASPSHH